MIDWLDIHQMPYQLICWLTERMHGLANAWIHACIDGWANKVTISFFITAGSLGWLLPSPIVLRGKDKIVCAVSQVLTIEEMEYVDAKCSGNTDKAFRLVEVLSRKADDRFPVFIKCLRQCAHDHVARKLCEGESISRQISLST